MNPTVYPATLADAAAIAFHHYPADADASERPVYAAWVRGKMEAGEYVGLLARRGEDVLAGAGLLLLDWGPTRGNPGALRARLVNVWTHELHRRRGLARRLTEALLAEARAQGIGAVSLGSTQMARPLYESLGFKPYPHEMLLKLEKS